MLTGVAEKHSFTKLENVTMRMTVAEGELWFSFLLRASSYLEWGTGGSTVMAAWRATQKQMPSLQIDTLDSSMDWWYRLRRKHLVLAEAESLGRLSFHRGDIGQTSSWGDPKQWSNRSQALQAKQARSYVENNLRCCYDLILIDGRFREACAMSALRFAHNATNVMIHDASRYVQGHAVKRHYDIISGSGELVVLRPKEFALAQAKSSASDGENRSHFPENFTYLLHVPHRV